MGVGFNTNNDIVKSRYESKKAQTSQITKRCLKDIGVNSRTIPPSWCPSMGHTVSVMSIRNWQKLL